MTKPDVKCRGEIPTCPSFPGSAEEFTLQMVTVSGVTGNPQPLPNISMDLDGGTWMVLANGCYESINSTNRFKTVLLQDGVAVPQSEAVYNPGNLGDDFALVNTARIDVPPEGSTIQVGHQEQAAGNNWRRTLNVILAIRVKDFQ